jgi:serine/threonine-protein kinase
VNTEALEDPLIGKTLSGRFRILEPLGSGGMGKVYKAMQSPLDRIVALKVLNPKYNNEKDPGFERRFFLEAALTAKLHHPNTITVHDYGRTEDGMLFIAMEFVEGETLQQMLQKEKTLPWARALNIAGQICRSLREAHKLGVIHRDLKPANVMVLHEETGSDLVKVLDFGLVKPFLPDALPKLEPDLTQAGVLLGSPLYMAPESARSEADPRADIYSLGVLLFQVICGRPPFTGKDSIDIIVKHIREKPPRLKSLKPDLPDEVDAMVMRCLEKEPIDRYQSMDEMLEALKQVASATGLSGAFSDPRSSVVSSTSSQAVPRVSNPNVPKRATAKSIEVRIDTDAITAPQRNPLWIFIAGSAALALAIVVGVVIATHKTEVTPPPPKPIAVKPPPSVTPVAPVEPVKPKPPPELAPVAVVSTVKFAVSSVPDEATVSMDGRVVGITPFDLNLKASDDGSAKVALTFALEGYQSVTVNAEGSGTVSVAQTLKKKVAGKKKTGKDEHPPGYKDDPYQ